MAKKLFLPGQWKKLVKTVVKTGENSGVRISFYQYGIMFQYHILLAVAWYLALFRSISDLNSIVSLHCSNATWVLLYKVCFIAMSTIRIHHCPCRRFNKTPSIVLIDEAIAAIQ